MIPARIEFHPAAIDEVEETFRWYQERSPSAAAGFLAEFEHALMMIAEAPERPAMYLYETRRVLFRRFPFAVVYRVLGNRIEVVAVPHGRRRPGYWRSR